MLPEVMDIDNVAAYLRIGRRSVYALVKRGDFTRGMSVKAWLRNRDPNELDSSSRSRSMHGSGNKALNTGTEAHR